MYVLRSALGCLALALAGSIANIDLQLLYVCNKMRRLKRPFSSLQVYHQTFPFPQFISRMITRQRESTVGSEKICLCQVALLVADLFVGLSIVPVGLELVFLPYEYNGSAFCGTITGR